MTAPVELLPLRCVRCGTHVPAEVDEVAWVCNQCGQGLLLDRESGLAPLQVHFMAGVSPAEKGKPFWVASGSASLQREAYGTWGKKTGEAERFWNEQRRFFVPAFTLPLDTLLELGARYLLQPPNLEDGSGVPFEPVILSPEDVPALAEFIVLAIEAERKDSLKAIQAAVRLDSPELWVLP